tara:strand:+ start:384 stop:608 length:225 start_codon:yes stop_codon:yes gene_type:complete
MKHWKTKNEMGNGFQYDEKKHKELSYNSLLHVEKYEENTMRTNYLVRDIWNKKQIIELRDFINQEIENKEANDE